ncbi:hypothetical protein CENSYa_0462 [Cenarchaeum symbiosum A]|uniref:Uncharacterized protein n=1 Tax=Cenarchaeum symbiosum (strain A) TaxID=414004 RepID=A0RUS9_CENSY|nr:hypothetical protein CENSYa_0462 [Cenarchaeum symbiosum A]
MTKPGYIPLSEDAAKIDRLVKKQRFRNTEAFIDRAVKILLAWELDPESSLNIIQGYPLTAEQKTLVNKIWKPQEYERVFGEPEAGAHATLREGLGETVTYLKGLKLHGPENPIEYDSYPMLFRFYSRFAPVKIAMAVLAEMLYKGNAESVELEALRDRAFEVASALAADIVEYEKSKGIKRTRKVSTGLPKAAGDDPDVMVAVKRRFKDHYVGRIRKDRRTKERHFEGAPAALGLARAAEEDGAYRVYLTEEGRKFCMMENPILSGEYSRALSGEESAFITGMIRRLPLEGRLFDVALEAVKGHTEGPVTELLDERFRETIVSYQREHPEEAKRHNINLESHTVEESAKMVEGWRVATMGRLSELGLISWEIDSQGKSVFAPRGAPAV